MYEQIAQLMHERKYAQAHHKLRSVEARPLLGTKHGLNLLGVCERALGNAAHAVQAYLLSLNIDAKQSGVWTNLGNAYKDLNRLESSIRCHSLANSMSAGNDAQIIHNMGISMALSNRHKEAISLFQKSIDINPDNLEIYWDLARSQLATFDYKNGWLNYKFRWNCKDVGVRRFTDIPWDGGSLSGKKVFVYLEQGFGDYIQCVRFVKNLMMLKPDRIYLEVKPELKRIVKKTFSEFISVELIDYSESNPNFIYDVCISIVDLPFYFASDYEGLEMNGAYLMADKKTFQGLEFDSKKYNVGIVWSGSVTFKRNHFRSANLKNFLSSFSLPKVQLHSLQMGPKAKDLDAFKGLVTPLDGYIQDFDDTASILNNLDLVITTCTSIVHLCGALNKKCWVLLDYSPHWLWGVDDDFTNWYPSLRFFRQRAPGAWSDVFDRAQSELIADVYSKGLLS